ncbi:P-loop containing nucleoside triphosphate hydrolase protein [Martensiomyces pterosporus]|nr:P-loop containing nucleoside triphosphate hydrolase protein [Martensiomyces pterosporus]
MPLVVSPEYSASIFDFLTFSWASPLLRLGRKVTIDSGDLYHLEPKDRPLAQWRKFAQNRKKGRSLLVSLYFVFLPELLVQCLLTLLGIFLSYGEPFLMQRMMKAIQQHHNHGRREGLGSGSVDYARILDAFGLLLVGTFQTFVSNHKAWIRENVYFKLQGLFTAELSAKALRRCRSTAASTKPSAGESKKGESAQAKDGNDTTAASNGRVISILTSESRTLGGMFSTQFNTLFIPVNICIGVWYLYSLLGISALIGIAISVLQYPLNSFLVKYTRIYDRKLRSANDERVSMITEMFQGIRAIKLFGWQSKFVERVRATRERQLVTGWKLMLIKTPIGIISSLTSSLTLVVVFAAYTAVFGNKVTADVVFTSMSVFSMVRSGIDEISRAIPRVVHFFVSLDRVESFMAQGLMQPLEDRVAVDTDAEVVGFENASFTWSAESPTCDIDAGNEARQFSLDDITLRFPVGGFSIIMGPTGCGKSSLLSALVGEMQLTSGRILIPTADSMDVNREISGGQYREVAELSGEGLVATNIAYVSQEAWLRNATIRENILFGEPYVQERYEEVLRVCALKPDLRIFKAGDMTEIGERGVTLSGGQKQRVALARAVYSSRRILLIDDCLSAVDAHTGKHILSMCLLGKTRLMRGRTKILVTHHVSACLPHSDYVVVLKDGRVALSGPPDHVQSSSHFSNEFADIGGSESAVASSGDAAATSSGGAKQEEADGWTQSVNDLQTEDEYTRQRQRALSEQLGEACGAHVSILDGVLVDDEERETGYVQPQVWLGYIRRCGTYRLWLLILVLIMFNRSVGISQDYWLRLWAKSASEASTPNHSATYWLGVYLLIGVAKSIMLMGAPLLFTSIRLKAARKIHEELVSRILSATPRFFDKTPIGRITSRFSSDMSVIDDDLMSLLMSLIYQIINTASVLLVISLASPSFIIVAAVFGVLYFTLAAEHLNSTRELKRLEAISTSPLLSLFSEIIAGTVSIRAFGAQHQYIKEAINRVYSANRADYLVCAANWWLVTRLEFLGSVITFSAAVLILLNLDRLDPSMAAFILVYAVSFTNTMRWCINVYSYCEISMNSVERINQYLKVEQEPPLEATPENKPPPVWPQTGNIEVEDLVIEYVPGVPVLHDLSLSVRHGEKIGVYPDELVWDALKRVYLVRERGSQSTSATASVYEGSSGGLSDSTLEHMSGIFTSLDAEIKENGQNLSLGQRQLVALARALVRRSRLIIMDEATASVDFDTDSRIQRTIRGPEFANSTLLCIAHRLRTIIDYDRILVLDKGRIAEFDTPWNLLQKGSSSIFKAMCIESGEHEYLFGAAQRKNQAD